MKEMKLVYENACKWEKPKMRLFTFAEPTHVRMEGRPCFADVLSVKLPIKAGAKVYASSEPVSIGVPKC